MKASYVQRGETIDYKNTTVAVIAANDIVAMTSRIAVAATEIQIGAVGTVNVVGVYDIPAASGVAFTVGQSVYYKDGVIVADSAGAIPAGFVVEPKTSTSTTARVKIG